MPLNSNLRSEYAGVHYMRGGKPGEDLSGLYPREFIILVILVIFVFVILLFLLFPLAAVAS